MLVKDLADNVVTDERIRWEYVYLLDRCVCSRLAVEGRCTPRRCFPGSYYAILGNRELTIEFYKVEDINYKRIILVGDEEYLSWTKPETPSEI